MQVAGGAGGLEAVAQSLAHEVVSNPDDWEKRRKAIISMQQAVDDVGKSGQGGPTVFTADLWRHLKEPLKHTLAGGGVGVKGAVAMAAVGVG
eukprot:jgi/Undpi1/3226/HiC_scaffold_15.g06600.m1